MNDAQFVGRTAETSFMAEYLAHTMAVRIRAFVLAEHVQDDHKTLEFRMPATWWQHLKCSFPLWYRKRWPVRWHIVNREVDIKVQYTYPDCRLALPPDKFGTPVVFATVTPSRDCE